MVESRTFFVFLFKIYKKINMFTQFLIIFFNLKSMLPYSISIPCTGPSLTIGSFLDICNCNSSDFFFNVKSLAVLYELMQARLYKTKTTDWRFSPES